MSNSQGHEYFHGYFQYHLNQNKVETIKLSKKECSRILLIRDTNPEPTECYNPYWELSHSKPYWWEL